MSNPVGTIQSLQIDESVVRAIVEVDVREACPRCAAGKGCGAGLFSGVESKRTVEALVDSDISLGRGDTVELRLAGNNLLAASFLVYGLPLLGAIVAAGIAYLLRLGDLAAALAAIAGLVSGFFVGRHKLHRAGCIDEFVPHVEKLLRNAGH
jgi:sigma-E factor negative regulatory protein RseC